MLQEGPEFQTSFNGVVEVFCFLEHIWNLLVADEERLLMPRGAAAIY